MIYVMSDIHGNAIRFNSIMEQIDLQPEDTLYILGMLLIATRTESGYCAC